LYSTYLNARTAKTKYVFDYFVGVDASVVCVGVHMHVSLQLLSVEPEEL